MTTMKKKLLYIQAIQIAMLVMGFAYITYTAFYHHSATLISFVLYQLVCFVSMLYFYSIEKEDTTSIIQIDADTSKKIKLHLAFVGIVLIISGSLIDFAASKWNVSVKYINRDLIIAGIFVYIEVLFILYSKYRHYLFVFFHIDWIVGGVYLLSGLLCSLMTFPFTELFLSVITIALLNVKAWKLLLLKINASRLGVPSSINIEKIKDVLLSAKGVQAIVTFKVWNLSINKNVLWAKLLIKKGLSESDLFQTKRSLHSELKKYKINCINIEIVQNV